MIILKSYFKKKKFTAYTLMIFTFSIIFLNAFILGTYYFGSYLKKCAREMYGSYHYCVYGVDKSVAESIKGERTSYRSAIFQSRISDNKYYIYCEEDYFELAGIDVVLGQFPESQGQIMCNKAHMYSLGYADDEMIGKKISVDGEEFTVSGIVDWQFYNDFDLTGGLFVYNMQYNMDRQDDEDTPASENDVNGIKHYYNVMIQNKDDNFLKEKNNIIKKYDLLKSQVGINVDYLLLSYRDESDRLTGIMRLEYFIFAVISITIIFLNSGILLLANGQIDKINNVYRKLGINKELLYFNITKSICIILAVSFVVINFTAYIISKRVFDNMNFLKICILPQFIAYVIPVLFLIFIVSYKHLQKIYTGAVLKRLSRLKKSEALSDNMNIYTQLAKNINFMGKGQYIFTVISAAFVGIVFICMMFYGKMLRMELRDVNDFEYRLTYEGDVDVEESLNEYYDFLGNMRNEIEKIEGSYYIPVCIDLNQATIVEKSLISKRYWDYLQKHEIEVKEQLLTNNRYIDIDVVTIGLEDYYCEFYGIKREDFESLSDSECIVIRNVNIDNVGLINNGIKENSMLNVYYYEDFEFVSRDLKVRYVYDDLDMKLENTENKIILLVKNELLQKMRIYSYPKLFYIKCPKERKMEILDVIKGTPDIDIVDISSFNNRVENINNVIRWTVVFIMVSVIAFLIINIWVIMKTREKEMKKVRTILKVFGVPDKKVIYVFLYDVTKMFTYSYLLAISISVIFCYGFVKETMTLSIYLRYFIPYNLFVFLLVGITVMVGVFGIQVKRYLLNINIAQELKEESM